MSPNEASDLLTQAMMLVMCCRCRRSWSRRWSASLVSLLQALTQVQEQTVSFAVKLVAVALTIAGDGRTCSAARC